MYVVLVSLVLTLAVAFFTWCYNQKRRFKCLDHVRGPPTLPIIGNALDIGKNPVESLRNMSRFINEYGPITRLWIGPSNLMLLVSDPDFCEILLSSPKYIRKSPEYAFFRPWLDNGLLVSDESYWHKRRKIITPAFHFKILEQFVPVFNAKSEILIKSLMNEIGNEASNIHQYVTAYTLDTICETAMGTTVNAQRDPNNEYVKAAKTMCYILIQRMFSSWKQYNSLFQFSSDFKLQTKVLKVIKGFSTDIIEQRRKTLAIEEVDNEQTDEDDVGQKKKTAFLDVLLKSSIDGIPLSNADIREEVDTFMFEGHDTTASAISFTMYETAKHPEIQEKIFEELYEIFGTDKERYSTLQDLSNMKYLELVIKETLRMYPTVPYFGRELAEDIIYKGNIYPKGVSVYCVIYNMHRRPDLFPNPLEYNPDRFSPENVKGKHPYSYIPFSAGPRNCVGQKFAMNELKVSLSNIFRNFKLSPADSKYDVILSGEAILKSDNDVHVKLHKRIY